MAETHFVHIKDIASLHQFIGSSPPHPLISIIRKWPNTGRDLSQIKFTSDLFYMALKREVKGAFQYGRSSYDYQEGTMVFISPGQVATFSTPDQVEESSEGWAILFHPDLIRSTELGRALNDFSFFNYEINEALHVSEKEKKLLTILVEQVEGEINQNIDKHSQAIIIQHLQTILNYCNRFYDRQFYLRTNQNKGVIREFETFLKAYFSSQELSHKGMPSIARCGKALNMSGAYLSDLLKAETGKSAKEHIYQQLIDRAKTNLLNSSDTVSEIAYRFGFEYPQNFSKLFKAKTGMSPSEYRNLN